MAATAIIRAGNAMRHGRREWVVRRYAVGWDRFFHLLRLEHGVSRNRFQVRGLWTIGFVHFLPNFGDFRLRSWLNHAGVCAADSGPALRSIITPASRNARSVASFSSVDGAGATAGPDGTCTGNSAPHL